MREADGKGAPLLQKELLRFVRTVAAARSPLRLRQADPSGALMLDGDGGPAGKPARSVLQATLDQARSLGLVLLEADTVRATREALPFLRRALLGSPEAFQEQHRAMKTQTVAVEGVRQAVRVNELESPLGACARLKEKSGKAFLPPEAIAAGERLHADFTRAHLQPRLTMAYEPLLSSKTKGGAGGAAEISDSAMSARFRVGKAMEAIGPELCGVALDVCCFQKGLELVERERQWPARSAKLMLRTALMALSRHYAPPRKDTRRSHVWGDEGFRPQAADAGITKPAAGPPRP
ncbi:DUF6456 domain-containing protein [Rhizobium sp. Root483D2]|uniref:DUF6456 domain-containing protein n=1 Tax=Rhizobium sp. Root483D2 TaxID=1736545 RepID=UPI000712AA98|nr:DUF6456 domain-containing protein [Rhizobium sp. Root483D2]KQY28376.1 hypothetical protein ASD32_24725 [Rhizobium sp. Root483D2]